MVLFNIFLKDFLLKVVITETIMLRHSSTLSLFFCRLSTALPVTPLPAALLAMHFSLSPAKTHKTTATITSTKQLVNIWANTHRLAAPTRKTLLKKEGGGGRERQNI